MNVAAGQLGMPPTPAGQDFQLTANVPAALSEASEFEQIILKADSDASGRFTRIRDVARVELGARSYSQLFKVDGRPAGGIAIYQLPGANALNTAREVHGLLDELAPRFPAGLAYSIPFDTTVFVQKSVTEVYHTLLEAGVLVLLVIVIFLQNWRATLIPATTIPVTIVGAFAAMAMMGFSVNLLTLFAVVLAIGIVVDDAIVVVEGVTQHIERGQAPKAASIAAMRELFGPIVGITLVLMSVFLPPAFMPGITGQMYRQFALVIAATALISAINAVTLSPTQSALWLRAGAPSAKKNVVFRVFNAWYEPLERAYTRLIRAMVERSARMALIVLLLVALAAFGLTRIPSGFLPTEDQGYLLVAVQMPDGASLERTEKAMDKVARLGLGTPGVQRAIAIGTGGPSPLDGDVSLANAGIVYLMLKNWDERGHAQNLDHVYRNLSTALAQVEEAGTRILIPPPIQGLGASNGFQMQVQLTDGSYDFARLQAVTDQMVRAANANPALQGTFTAYRANVPQLSLKVDRTQASTLNVDVGDVYNLLQSYLGSTYVNLFTRFGHNYMVYVQADPQHRLNADDIRELEVRGKNGDMVPIGALTDIRPSIGPSVISLYNLLPSATINGAAAPGFSSGQALAAMEGIARSTLPGGMGYEWTALAYQEQLVGNSAYLIFALAMLLVYCALAGQYESWITPVAVIVAVPLALLGTVLAIFASGYANNIYVQIGLVLLIALSAKNAILIVEMAREGRAGGASIIDAVVSAARVRFRPILMTSFTFILGVLPLVLASGAGANARRSLGIAVASGMLASTCLAVLFVPTLYVVLQRWAERRAPDGPRQLKRSNSSRISPPVFAKYFIERPVLANVIAIVTVLLGGVALFSLPVTQYPPITPPTIQVTASYPGASARTLVETVALPIEQQVNGVEKMLYMQSTCTSDGRYTLTVTFAVGTDLNVAQVLVQNRVSAALAQLPQAVQQQGVITKQKSTAILQIITLTSPDNTYDALFLSNFATLRLRDKLVRVPGVADVNVFGVGQYSMRVWLNPSQLRQRSLMPSDVLAAIQKQSVFVAAGQINMPPAPTGQDFQLTIELSADLSRVEDFEQIIVKSESDSGGRITRLRDVARVELGSQSYGQFFKVDASNAGGVAIYQLPDANALDTAARVRAAMAQLSREFPPKLLYTIPFDTTVYVNASVSEVYHTLFEAGVLVLLVIVLFLQDWRATLVPATTVPVTIIGSFAAMSAMGFTINLLTLFAVVLAIGIVVDDAIVVVEGTVQHIERGKSPRQASIAAMQELFGPILGVTLVLMSVFVPPAFMPGVTGQMYRQFALVIAATALISAVNAATLKPAQCALWLRRPDPARRKSALFRGFNAVYGRLENFYLRQVSRVVQRAGFVSVLGLALMGLAAFGLTRIPTGFIPTEDQGYAMITVQLPDGASLARTEQVMAKLARLCSQQPAVERTISIGGLSPLDGNASLANAGILYLIFKDWSKRGPHQDLRSIYDTLSTQLRNFQEARTMVIVPPPIQGLGLSGGFQMQLELNDGSYDFKRLQQNADRVIARANADPMIRMALTPLRSEVPQVEIKVNRAQAQSLGVDVGDVYSTVQTYLGSSFVNLFMRYGHNYMVYAQADGAYRLNAENLADYDVRGQGGQMVPLGTLATVRPVQAPAVITLYNLFPTATINGAAKDAYSSGQGLEKMADIAARTLGPGLSYEWTAMSYQEKLAGDALYVIFALALAAGVLRARGAIRIVGHPGRRHAGRAAGAARHGRRPARAGRRQQHLRADRPGAADCAVGQERDPDRRDGARRARAGPEHRGRHARGREGPIPTHRDDLADFYFGRDAPAAGRRRRGQCAKVLRPHGRHRHAGVHLPGGAVRAGLFRCFAALGGTPRRATVTPCPASANERGAARPGN